MGRERDEEELEDEITNEEDFVRLVAENMAIHAGALDGDEAFMPQARELLRSFKETEGHLPVDYAELEAWAGYVRWRAGRPRKP